MEAQYASNLERSRFEVSRLAICASKRRLSCRTLALLSTKASNLSRRIFIALENGKQSIKNSLNGTPNFRIISKFLFNFQLVQLAEDGRP
mmetsp:Transcript_62367/g.167313  ORF Transcript_62367/g.167313 Transcript_62367/m.167313 type:complete len:90 (-) Transcript_62367:367-636(-)